MCMYLDRIPVPASTSTAQRGGVAYVGAIMHVVANVLSELLLFMTVSRKIDVAACACVRQGFPCVRACVRATWWHARYR